MKLILATGNQNKVREIKQILGNKFDQIVSAKEVCLDTDVEETGLTFLENARLKAMHIHMQAPDCAVLSDDSGLCVDALDGAPGVYSNRYFLDGDDKANRTHLLGVLKDTKNRLAHFESWMVLILPNGVYTATSGVAQGSILTEEVGDFGFGYDCVFFSKDLNKSFGACSQEEKNSVSHRGKALKTLCKVLDNF